MEHPGAAFLLRVNPEKKIRAGMICFKKYDPRQKVYLPNGTWLQFEDLGNGFGVLVTEDSYIIDQLRQCIDKGRGGVEEITKAELEEVKKKEPMSLFGKLSQEILDTRKMSALFRSLSEGAAADGDFPSDTGYAAKQITPPTKPTGYRPRISNRLAVPA